MPNITKKQLSDLIELILKEEERKDKFEAWIEVYNTSHTVTDILDWMFEAIKILLPEDIHEELSYWLFEASAMDSTYHIEREGKKYNVKSQEDWLAYMEEVYNIS